LLGYVGQNWKKRYKQKIYNSVKEIKAMKDEKITFRLLPEEKEKLR
jgi:hypothetical protein